MRFLNKTVLVTGAASGIGRGIAVGFAKQGAAVLCIDIDAEGLRETADLIGKRGGRVDTAVANVARAEQVDACIRTALGDSRAIDILVNNAGINMAVRIDQLAAADWQRTFDVNVMSVFLMSKALWPHFQARRSGVIVNVASIMGQVGGIGAPAYCSSKAAIIMLSKCLAKDGAAHGIRVNTVCPGYIDTPPFQQAVDRHADPRAERARLVGLQPLGRLGTADDVADAVSFLASQEAAFISGTELTVDGAFTATQVD